MTVKMMKRVMNRREEVRQIVYGPVNWGFDDKKVIPIMENMRNLTSLTNIRLIFER